MSERSEDMSRLAAREQQKEKSEDGNGDQSEPAENTNTPSDAGTAENPSDHPAVNVKDRESNLFMYLPESLGNDVDLACQSVNLTYQRESGTKLGKNRYLYPIILMVGVDTAVNLSYDEIQNLVERIDDIEDAF